MPFESEKQRRFMWANHPGIARKWAHHQYADGGEVMDAPQSDKASPGNGLAAILLRMKDDPNAPGKPAEADPSALEEPQDSPEGEAVNPDLQMAAEDLVAAQKSNDPTQIASAFQAMFDICMAHKDSYTSDDQE